MTYTARRRVTTVPLLAALALASVLTACSASGGTSGVDSVGAPADLVQGGSAPALDTPKEGAPNDEVTVPTGSMLARQAEISLEVDSPSAAAAQIRALALAARGSVLSEMISTDSSTDLPTMSTIVVSVPSASLDTTLDAIARVGTVTRRASNAQDVKASYVDTAARVETMRASVDRVRALMAKAEKITDIVSLEGELSRRQADLEALEAQLRSLKDAVAQSPITVSLALPGTTPANDSGFWAGLKTGWSAFTSSMVVLVTLLGAVLPFLALAAAILVPLWIMRKRRRTAPDATETD